jgi:hypothetical protein
MEQNYEMTYFVNFTREKGDISLAKYHEMVSCGATREIVEKVRSWVGAGNSDAAADIKKKLTSVTPSAHYRDGRKREFFRGHTGIICLDYDHVGARLAELKAAVCRDPHTLHCAVSPSGDGLKVLVAVCMPEDAPPPADWDAAVAYHAAAYDAVMRHYFAELGISPDTSGRDITRLCFVSYDPEAYLNEKARPIELDASLLPAPDGPAEALPEGEPKEAGKEGGGAGADKEEAAPAAPKKSVRAGRRKEDEEDYSETLEALTRDTTIAMRRRMAFLEIICRNLYREDIRYREGNRHKFLYMVACRLNDYGIPQVEAVRLMERLHPLILSIEHEAKAKQRTELVGIVHDVYEKGKGTFGKKRIPRDVIARIYMEVEFKRVYDVRFNTLSLKLEVRDRDVFGPRREGFRDIEDRDICDMAKATEDMCKPMSTMEIREDITSGFVPFYDPVEDMLGNLPEWDGEDHIGNFADSVETTDPARFRQLLKMFYCGMIASYPDPKRTNDIMPVLYTGSQGHGKTYFIDNLLPDYMEPNRHEGGPDKNVTDFLTYVATKLLIFVDEMQNLDRDTLNFLQEVISRKQIEFRAPYAHYSQAHIHRASFVGACNNTSFMSGKHGNRRFFIIEVIRFHNYKPDFVQLFAQVKHLLDEGFKYWFTPEEQDELEALSYTYQYNDDEYELVRKYVREYGSKCKDVQVYKARQIFDWLAKFDTSLVPDKGAIRRLAAALGRRKVPAKVTHGGKDYICYLLNAEQAEYCETHRKGGRDAIELDVDYDKRVPREVLVAGGDAKIADIVKAKELLDQADNDFEKAKGLYRKYIIAEKDISFRNTDTLPF